MPGHFDDRHPDDIPDDDDGYVLAVPFVVCQSNGGPFDDAAFVAGFQAGIIDQALHAALTMGVESLRFTVDSRLEKQLELIGMNRGFHHVTCDPVDGYPGWSDVCFRLHRPNDPGPVL